MTDSPFIDHRAIRKLAEQTPKLSALLASRDFFDSVDPVSPAVVDEAAPVETKGFVCTADGRMLFRLVGQQEAQDLFGVDAATTAEAFLAIERFSKVGQIEEAALDAQARAVKLLRACEAMFAAMNGGPEISSKERVKIGSMLHTIRKEDEAKADRIAEMKAQNAATDRSRKWCMRQLGIPH